VFAVDGNQMVGEMPGWLLSGILGCYVDQNCNGLFDLSGDQNTFYCPTASTIKGERGVAAYKGLHTFVSRALLGGLAGAHHCE
jgi:hypothetical protein